MRNFSVICKKKLKQILTPHGYKNRRSMFLKLEDEIFILIQAKGDFSCGNSSISMFISAFPYCMNLRVDDFDPREPVDDTLFALLNKIKPDTFTPEYYLGLVQATSEEGTIQSLDSICAILEEYALPYIHKFTDLEFYYSEYPKLARMHIGNPFVLSEELFGLSIKLQKYENAIFYVNQKLSIFDRSIELAKSEIDALKGGSIPDGLQFVKKKKSEIVALLMHSTERAIIKWEREADEWNIVKNALLSNDRIFLDNYINKIEANSRNVLREILG